MPHPLLYEINTRCWLRELSEAHGRPITLANVPDSEFAHYLTCSPWWQGNPCSSELLQLRDIGMGAILDLLRGPAIDAAGALEDAVTNDRHHSLAIMCRGDPARGPLVGALRQLAARAAKCSRDHGLPLAGMTA